MKMKTMKKLFYTTMIVGFLFLGTTNIFANDDDPFGGGAKDESETDGKVLCSDLGVNIEGEKDALCDILF